MKTAVMSLSVFLCAVLFFSQLSCEKTEIIIPQSGYQWPQTSRSYWPTNGWKTTELEDVGINPQKMEKAHLFARNDSLMRAFLVVKSGYLVYEKYYGDGGVEVSSNLWSVTKSFTSALVGFIYDDKMITDTHAKMVELMPSYPNFGDIRLHHVLTHTTGLNWAEEGPLWVKWIFSDDWVDEVLSRGYQSKPGKQFFYSSGNSHILTALVHAKSQVSVGQLAKERLFTPLGIEFHEIDNSLQYNNWLEYTYPEYQTWRKDPNGIECAGFGLYLTARDMAKFGYLYLNKGMWDGQAILSEKWVELSTKEHMHNIYGRYSYGYHWYITNVGGEPAFLASGFGGQIIGIVPSLDLVVVLKYEAENPIDPKSGSQHDDMHLFELVVSSCT
jgi:CubicO group peptidase (beta-lactamase class C family)